MLLYGLIAGLLAAVASPDTLVICNRDLQPALAPWIAHRQAQGHSIEIIEPEATFGAQRTAVRTACERKTIENLLIVGDANVVPAELAAAKINVRYGSESKLATDFGLSDIDGDREPDLRIGRLPVRTPEELSQVVRKIISYETDNTPGDWRRRVNLVAGTGRFSMIADKVIETTAGRLISEMVPADREVHFTYGSWRSPFCPPPRHFSKHTLARLNEGCSMWVYVGHGLPDELDYVHVENDRYPILARGDLNRLNCQAGQPIAVLLACYTGAFDGPQPSVAERFLLEPGGPVAVLASSRVSMPYGNTALGTELMRSYFKDRDATLGEVVRQAKRRLLQRESADPHRKLVENIAALITPNQADRDQEKWEHAQMYNLLGDPLLRLKHPADLELAAPELTATGAIVRVTGKAPCGGSLRYEWTLPNEKRLTAGTMRREVRLDAAAEKEQIDRYLAANATVLATETIEIDAGHFAASISVPELPPGEYVLRAILSEERAWASSATRIKIAAARAARAPSSSTTN